MYVRVGLGGGVGVLFGKQNSCSDFGSWSQAPLSLSLSFCMSYRSCVVVFICYLKSESLIAVECFYWNSGFMNYETNTTMSINT